jgi:hypothetical protein
MYQQIKDLLNNKIGCVKHFYDNAFIPFDPANTDFQMFKTDLANGVELQDPDGNVMTQDQVTEFLATLP